MSNNWNIDPTDLDMCQWACKYLARRFSATLPKMVWENEYSYYEKVMNHQKEGGERENLLKNMQAAWRQKKYKEEQMRRGKIPCSFMLSTTAVRNLDRLSKSLGETINETLESIISGTYLSDKENKKQQLAERKQRKKVIPVTPIPSDTKNKEQTLAKIRKQLRKNSPED